MFFNSTRLTLIPHGSVASSRVARIFVFDRFSGCQCLVEFQITDDVSKCCSRQVFDRHDWILDSVGISFESVI